MTRSDHPDPRAPRRVLLAPDKFKGSLTALRVARAVADGLHAVLPDVETVLLPVADGGDGTVAAALAAGYDRVPVTADGPTGVPLETCWARRGDLAVVELAAVTGLDLLPGGSPDPLGASTYGLGQVVGHALDAGVTEVVLGVGGSASTDGGAGLVQALGAVLRDREGRELARGGAALADLASLEVSRLAERVAGVHFTVATDVDNPLLGPTGAAAVFGPQKGADPATITRLESALATWAGVVADTTGTDVAERPGTGAAGGTAFAACALLGADLTPGIELVLDLVGFHDALGRGVDLVVTGEGSLDEQTLSGKAPVGVARAVRGTGVPVVAVAGRCLLGEDVLRSAGIAAAYPLTDVEPDPAVSIRDAERLLVGIGERIAHERLA